MIGNLDHINKLIGSLTSNITTVGEIKTAHNIVGNLNLDVGEHTDYDGDYIITPTVDSQLLMTKNKLLRDNMTINEIPYYETHNEYGKTIYIGSEVEIDGN